MSDKIEYLTGEGLEYLTDSQGNPIAMFINGNMPTSPKVNSDEPTKKAA